MFALIRRLKQRLSHPDPHNERPDDPHGALVDALRCELAYHDYVARVLARRQD